MSAAALYVIECDGMNCDCPAFTSTTDDLAEARRQAAEAGWTYSEEDGTDWGRGHRRFKTHPAVVKGMI